MILKMQIFTDEGEPVGSMDPCLGYFKIIELRTSRGIKENESRNGIRTFSPQPGYWFNLCLEKIYSPVFENKVIQWDEW